MSDNRPAPKKELSYDDLTPAQAAEAVRRLWAENRATCGWFVREDFVPYTADECKRSLNWIKDKCDRKTWVLARKIEQCL